MRAEMRFDPHPCSRQYDRVTMSSTMWLFFPENFGIFLMRGEKDNFMQDEI